MLKKTISLLGVTAVCATLTVVAQDQIDRPLGEEIEAVEVEETEPVAPLTPTDPFSGEDPNAMDDLSPMDPTPPADQAPAPEPIEAPTDLGVDAAPMEPGQQVINDLDPADPAAGAARARDFEGDDVGQVLRLLARQARINLVVSEQVVGTVTMRLEDVTAMEAIRIIAQAQNLFVEELNNVYYVKTQGERAAEPRESAFFTFNYARATDIKPLLQRQLQSGAEPQVDERINTIFYSEVRSNLDNIVDFLEVVDRPTKQVMIEARLVEITANPEQKYGINWSGVLEDTTIRYGGSPLPELDDGLLTYDFTVGPDGSIQLLDQIFGGTDRLSSSPLNFDPTRPESAGLNFLEPAFGQFAILSAPQLSLTLNLINRDSDAEFLANPRIVTADNQEAVIRIIQNQPVPQLNFNEQTATAVFGGFEEREFGNTLIVKPQVNKENFITLSVRPEISNKVRDEFFVFAGAEVRSPVVDTRSLESNVMIRSGDTLAIGGLLQDQTLKRRVKVPILGDIPILGYLFSETINQRQKRNLLIFVTPTVIDERYGTGLEDQVTGLKHSGEEFADPTGWRNNAKGSIRLIPTSQRHIAAEYPVPGVPEQPVSRAVNFQDSAKPRR